MKTLFFIAMGGMIGAVARHGVSVGFTRLLGHGFPYATMFVNIIGSLLMGYVAGYALYHGGMSLPVKMFLTVGILGAFTTFSTFSLDLVTLLQKGALLQGGLYLVGSVLLSIIALMLGFGLSKIGGTI